jgi:hypothetical protein
VAAQLVKAENREIGNGKFSAGKNKKAKVQTVVKTLVDVR